jgi:lipoprotein-anchoring transpeptidase ErfK/SrfK
MKRRKFLATLTGASATLASPAIAQFFSDGQVGTARSPYPYRVLGPNQAPPSQVGIVPPVGSGLDAYDRPYYDPNVPTEYDIQTLKVPKWDQFFETPENGMIVASIEQRVVHYCSEDYSIQRAYLCSVPRSAEYERKGRTKIVHKRFEPTWIPTPDMRKKDPSLPKEVGPGPANPLGTRAMNLDWQYYRIHGIDRPEKVGQKVSSGCFGLYNDKIEELFELAVVGTQVFVV